MRPRLRRKRVWIPVTTVVAIIVVLVVLVATDLLVLIVGGKDASNAPTIPACNARNLAEGFTYHFRDPHRGELVMIYARGHIGGTITRDPSSRDLDLTKRVVGTPGDTVVGRHGFVFVDGQRADNIPTDPFPAAHLGPDQYFVLGDNRSVSDDSRDFAPVARAGIFGRGILVYWPLGRFGTPGYNKNLKPPGAVVC